MVTEATKSPADHAARSAAASETAERVGAVLTRRDDQLREDIESMGGKVKGRKL